MTLHAAGRSTTPSAVPRCCASTRTRAQPILDVFRGADPTRVAPDNTVVLVQNGTPSSGLGERGGRRAAGPRASSCRPTTSARPRPSTWRRRRSCTREGAEGRAALLASALAVDPVVAPAEFVVGADVTLVLGADWPGVGEALRPETPGLVPTTTTTAPTTTTTRPGATTTSSTVIGNVPTSPASADC